MFSANSSQVSSDKLFVEDVFSTWLYTGNGSTQTITNGIDLAGKGGLVWIKDRGDGASFHALYDTARGAPYRISSNVTNAQAYVDGVSAFNSNGFNLGLTYNASGNNFVSWTFREAPKFFDVVTYTGDGVNGRQIAHNLGVTPGCIIYKCTSTATSWLVLHRSLPNGFSDAINLNTTDAAFSLGASFAPTATTFTMSNGVDWNQNGQTYVAYLFAHDTTSDGIIQCGSYTGNGSGTGPVINLGWEPQWVLVKNASAAADWRMYDNMRGMPTGAGWQQLYPNLSGAEVTGQGFNLQSTGFQPTTSNAGVNASGNTYIYIAIRRGPMRTPTSGTSVFSPVTRNGTGATATVTGVGFPADLFISRNRNNYVNGNHLFNDRLRGTSAYLKSQSTNAEQSLTTAITAYTMDGFTLGSDQIEGGYNYSSNADYIQYFLRRAPSLFDVVCYRGTGTTAQTISHNLGVAPELIITKNRSATWGWAVYAAPTWGTNVGGSSGADCMFLNLTDAAIHNNGLFNNTQPTATVFSVGSNYPQTNGNAHNMVAYLFASCPGVSKVGSYTGNGSSQTINCGFAAGARFVMIKRADSTGDWYVWDTARGIVAGNDPRLSLNSTAAEVTTDDSVDTDSSGFVVNQLSATNINVSSATYIYLAVA